MKDHNSASKTPHITELLTKIIPKQKEPERFGTDHSYIEYLYKRVNWDEVRERDLLKDEALIAWGGRPGAYDTVDASGFEAFVAHMDPVVTEANDVYVTDEGVYVYEFVVENKQIEDLQSAALTVLSELSINGVIEGLRPKEDIEPPNLWEQLNRHEDIEEFEIESGRDEIICHVEMEDERNGSELLEEIRTVYGIRYPKPDRIEMMGSGDNTVS